MLGLLSKPQKTSARKSFLKSMLCGFVAAVTIVETAITPIAAVMAETPRCGMEEHSHVSDCYTLESVLNCGMDESDTHTHGDDCYQYVLSFTCTKLEHTHNSDCYGGILENISQDDALDNNTDVNNPDSVDNPDMDPSAEGNTEYPEENHPFDPADNITNPDDSIADDELPEMYCDIDGVVLYAIARSVDVSRVEWALGMSPSGMLRLTINAAPGGVIPDDFIANTAALEPYLGIIDEILFDSSIKVIGQDAFKNLTSLKSVRFNSADGEIPELTTIKGGAFNGCAALSSVNLEDCINLQRILNSDDSATGSQLIEGGAFANTALTSLSLPSSVTEIGSCSFYNCPNMKNVYFAENNNDTITLGSHIFAKCGSLQTVNLENLKSNYNQSRQ